MKKKTNLPNYYDLRDQLESRIIAGEKLNPKEIQLYAKYCCQAPDLFHDYLDAKETLFNLIVPYMRKMSHNYAKRFPTIPYQEFLQEVMTEIWAKLDNFVWCKQAKTKEERKEFEENANKNVGVLTFASYIALDALQNCIAKNSKIYLGTMNLKFRSKIQRMQAQGLAKEEICAKLGIGEDRYDGIVSNDIVSSLHKVVAHEDQGEIELLNVLPDETQNLKRHEKIRELVNLLETSKLSSDETEAILYRYGFVKEVPSSLENRNIAKIAYEAVKKIAKMPDTFKDKLYEQLKYNAA